MVSKFIILSLKHAPINYYNILNRNYLKYDVFEISRQHTKVCSHLRHFQFKVRENSKCTIGSFRQRPSTVILKFLFRYIHIYNKTIYLPLSSWFYVQNRTEKNDENMPHKNRRNKVIVHILHVYEKCHSNFVSSTKLSRSNQI